MTHIGALLSFVKSAGAIEQLFASGFVVVELLIFKIEKGSLSEYQVEQLESLLLYLSRVWEIY